MAEVWLREMGRGVLVCHFGLLPINSSKLFRDFLSREKGGVKINLTLLYEVEQVDIDVIVVFSRWKGALN